jgi:hypothetical protein
MKKTFAAALLLLVAACSTYQTYEGAKRPRNEVAVIVGDYRIRAGAPISLYLRQVDGVDVPVTDHGAEVLAGQHKLLVDCIIAETHAISRHEIDADVLAGYRYKLVAETEPGMHACSDVKVESE